MIFNTKTEKNTKKKTGGKNTKSRQTVPNFPLPPEKNGKAGKRSVPYSLEEMVFYDDVLYDEW